MAISEIEDLETTVNPYTVLNQQISAAPSDSEMLAAKISDMNPAGIISDVKTDGCKSLERRAMPIKSLAECEADLAVHKEHLEEIATGQSNRSFYPEFPNLAYEALKLALAKEQITNDKINGHIAEAKKQQDSIKLLLDLTAEINVLKDGGKLSDKAKEILAKLKEQGIEVWKGGDELSKEQVSELKSLSSSQTDTLRSNLQILFTTKIQTLIQEIGTIMDVLKEIIRNDSKLKEKTQQR